MNPVEEDRALDGEEPDLGSARGREAMDPTTRHLIWIASGIGLLLAVLIGGWALSGHNASSIPVIEAQSGPVRVKPVNPGGMQALGAMLPNDGNGPGAGDGKAALAPPPETPRPDALKAEVDAARHDGAPPAPAPAPAKPQATLPPSLPPPTPRQTPADDNLLRTENTGRLAVQLAALDSEAAAGREWARLSRAHPALFSGKQPLVQQVDHAGHAIWRLRMRGFDSTEAAASFCRHARAQSVACTVADF